MKGSSSSGQKRYEKFIESYRNAYPQLSKEQQFRKGQELWKKVKNDLKVKVQSGSLIMFDKQGTTCKL